MDAVELALVQAADVARALVGAAVEVNLLETGGRNSRIWRVRNGERTFALKQYPPRSDDPRDRLSTEIGALRLMERNRIEVVPRVLGVDAERGYALLSWIDGRDVAAVQDGDIDAAVQFLAAIHGLRASDWAANHPLASEACLSGREIERQVDARLARLRSLCKSWNYLTLLTFPSVRWLPKWAAPRGRRSLLPVLILAVNFRRNGAALSHPISAFTIVCAEAMDHWHSSISNISAGMIL